MKLDDLSQLSDLIDELAASDPFSYSDRDSIVHLERVKNRLDSIVSNAMAAFDSGGEWTTDGAKTSVAWVSTRCHLPRGEVRAQLRRGRALPGAPHVAQAFSEGDIGATHVDALVRAQKTSEAIFARDEAMLVTTAKELKFAPFTQALAYWAQMADPDGADETDMERAARRDVYLTPSLDGMHLGKMTLDPVSGVIVADELGRLEQEMFDADWAKAKEELGRDPRIDELWRTPAQRRADALVEMAKRSRTAPADGRRPEPLVTILVDYPTLYGRICELANGQVISPGTLLTYLDSAWFERVVFAPGKRAECSPLSRFFTGATRRAIELRDRECTHEFCEETVDNCQIDHIVPYSQGGPTTQENGRVLCGFHNRLRNQGLDPPDGPDLPDGPEPQDEVELPDQVEPRDKLPPDG
jgi:hypothetical protein